MSKIEYRKCDVCGKTMDLGFKDYFSDGRRFLFALDNNLDICNECLCKLLRVKNDIKYEEKMMKYALDIMPEEYRKEGNEKLFAAYLEGVEAATNQLFKNRVKKNKAGSTNHYGVPEQKTVPPMPPVNCNVAQKD